MKPPKGTRAPGAHTVGYGKPPVHTRFRKGTSGNPSGRPPGMTAGRAKLLALKEAYRLLTVRVGDKLIKMPAIQVVMRSQIGLATKGNGPSQRSLLDTTYTIEQEFAAQEAARHVSRDVHNVSSRDMAKALLLALNDTTEEN